MATEFDPALLQKFEATKKASQFLAQASSAEKNQVLATLVELLKANTSEIIDANQQDLDSATANKVVGSLVDRLTLTESRILGLVKAVEEIIALADPIGDVLRGSTLPNGLQLTQLRVPFGVLGAIYEARPNVTVDLAALAIKSGNAILLRGGTAAENTNRFLVDLIQKALAVNGLAEAAVDTIDQFGRAGAKQLMQARGWVDVLIPRGSAELIQTVATESKVPVIETGAGIVHIFVDESADLANAVEIILNAKTQRPSVCNAVETLLVHERVVEELLPVLAKKLEEAKVTVFADEVSKELIPAAQAASESDWATEYLDLQLSVKVVKTLDEAIAHINTFSTKHTESILTSDYNNAEIFLNRVDSAVVMVNASTRFTDGGEFGFGAEVGISTQKLHARGPMGLAELTSTKWIVRGNGQIRK